MVQRSISGFIWEDMNALYGRIDNLVYADYGNRR